MKARSTNLNIIKLALTFAIALAINVACLNAAHAIIQNSAAGPHPDNAFDKSGASGGFAIMHGESVNGDLAGGLILFDDINKNYRSIVNENGVLMINIDGNGDLRRILYANGDLGASVNGTTIDLAYLSNGTNLFVGNGAGLNHTTADFNTGVGVDAQANVNTGNGNTTLGYRSLFANVNGNNNVAIGADALNGNTSGNNNIAIGYRAGDNLTSGNGNIIIGSDIDAPTATGNDQLNIGDVIYGNLTSNFIGIGVTSPSAMLDINGGVANFINGQGDILVQDDVEIDDDLFVADDIEFGGTINGGVAQFQFLTVTQNADILGDFDLSGDFNGDSATFSELTVTGNGSIGNNLTVGNTVNGTNGIFENLTVKNGLSLTNGGLTLSLTVTNGDIAVSNNNYTIMADTNPGDVDVLLPDPLTVPAGKIFVIKQIHGVNNTYINGNTANVELAPTQMINNGESYFIQFDGSSWWII